MSFQILSSRILAQLALSSTLAIHKAILEENAAIVTVALRLLRTGGLRSNVQMLVKVKNNRWHTAKVCWQEAMEKVNRLQ